MMDNQEHLIDQGIEIEENQFLKNYGLQAAAVADSGQKDKIDFSIK